MMYSAAFRRLIAGPMIMACILVLTACSDDDDDDAPAQTKSQPVNPTVEGPITGGGSPECCKIVFGSLEVDLGAIGYQRGNPFFADIQIDIGERGYQQREYFISGNAVSYINTEEMTAAGEWDIAEADSAAYYSRIVVARPVDPADFNGTVVVEWFNVTGGLDAAPDWTAAQTEIIRSGAAWVGVSAQFVGIEGGGAFPLHVKAIDAERYGALFHPGDSFSYDIFSQAAQAVRSPVGIDPLEGLQVERMIAVGQSQSASRLMTYVNAVHPTLDLFDAYLIHSRGDGSSSLSQAPQADISTPESVLVREDIDVPVIIVQAETDIFGLGYLSDRQDDSNNVRLWEVAGSAHSDLYTTIKGPMDSGDDPAVAAVIERNDARPPFIFCDLPINDGPAHWLVKAAISALDNWIRTGEPASSAPRLTVNSGQTDFDKDAVGNSLGGIRTPYVDVPTAILAGSGQGEGFCRLFGTTELLDASALEALYPSHVEYVNKVNASVDDAVAKGFIVPADAELIKAEAVNSGIGGPEGLLAP